MLFAYFANESCSIMGSNLKGGNEMFILYPFAVIMMATHVVVAEVINAFERDVRHTFSED